VLDGDPLEDFHLIGKPVKALFVEGNLVINRCGLEVSAPTTTFSWLEIPCGSRLASI